MVYIIIQNKHIAKRSISQYAVHRNATTKCSRIDAGLIRITGGRSGRLTPTSDIVVNDPRYGPRRSRHSRGRYRSRRLVRDRQSLHDLLLCRPAQPPIGAHIVPFFREKSCAVSQTSV